MKKALKIFFLLSFLYEDFKKLTLDLLRGKPELEGAFLLGPGTEVRSKLIEQLNKQELKFIIHGDGKHLLACHLISIQTNNIYIYFNLNNNNEINPCVKTQDNLLLTLTSSVNIPFYMKWLGYGSIHFEVFGNYIKVSEESFGSLPLGSTLLTTSSQYPLLHAVTEEIILKSFSLYNSNPYIKFINYILINPENNTLIVNTASGPKTFVANIELLDNFSNSEIIAWQKEQVRAFIKFFDTLESISYNEIKEFKQFIERFYDSALLLEWISNFQQTSLSRYKELLLFNYIAKNKLQEVEVLLNSGVDIDVTLLNGATPLYVAAHLGNLEIAKTLVDLKASIDLARNNKATPLMAASLNNHWKIIELLLEAKAKINTEDINSNTALTLASFKGNNNTVSVLLKFNPDINHKNAQAEAPISLAVSNGHSEIVKTLLNFGAKTDVRINGDSLLQTAIDRASPAIVKLLLSYAPELAFSDFSYDFDAYVDTNPIKEELMQFNDNPIAYILKTNNNLQSVIKALNNIEIYTDKYKEISQKIKDCLLKLFDDETTVLTIDDMNLCATELF